MIDTTIIRVSKETAKKLKEIKLTRLETYDEIIIRLLEKNNKKKNNG